MDPRNEDYYAETPAEKERRQLAEQKQVMKEAFKEALEEAGASNAPNQLERHTPSYEELVKLLGIC
nr:MAG TPA: Terminase DNA packaging enzyme small [Caudoviricetes sp.]